MFNSECLGHNISPFELILLDSQPKFNTFLLPTYGEECHFLFRNLCSRRLSCLLRNIEGDWAAFQGWRRFAASLSWLIRNPKSGGDDKNVDEFTFWNNDI